MDGKYVSVTSYKRDGTGIATPLWFVEDGDRLLLLTDADSPKVKRMRRNPEVLVAACNGAGKLTGEPYTGRAEVLDAEQTAHVEALMARKYRVDRYTVYPLWKAWRWITGHRGSDAGSVAIAVTPAA